MCEIIAQQKLHRHMVSVTALGKAQKNPGTSQDISSQGQLPSEGQ